MAIGNRDGESVNMDERQDARRRQPLAAVPFLVRPQKPVPQKPRARLALRFVRSFAPRFCGNLDVQHSLWMQKDTYVSQLGWQSDE